MKQQFFVGDIVKLNQLGVEEGNESVRESTHDWWSSKYISMLKHQDTAKVSKSPASDDDAVWLENNSFFLSKDHLKVVERAWQKNTGVQPVENILKVEVKVCDGAYNISLAGDFSWELRDWGDDIVEWRIADNVPPVVGDTFGFGAAADEIVADVSAQQEWTDKHYDNNYTLTQKDIERGFVKIDPYFVSKMWKIGSKDDSGALWHCFKTIARFGEKNSREREVKALYAQIKRLAEIEGVDLNG